MGNQDYIPQIRISENDPVNSVKSMEGSVIGVLFEKKGDKIQGSISRRIESIDQKIDEYESMCSKTEEFIEGKKKGIKELDEFLQKTKDQKEAYLIPIRKEIERIVKEANDKIYEMDLETFKMMKKKALNFEKGFDGVQKEFNELDDLLEKDKFIIQGLAGIQVPTGIQGLTGVRGPIGGHNDKNPVRGIGYGDSLANASVGIGIGTSSPVSKLNVRTDPETKAYARLDTLRDLLRINMDKLRLLKDGIVALKEERRRLKLIYDNICTERDYKLDLNMLSAFGFEDNK